MQLRPNTSAFMSQPVIGLSGRHYRTQARANDSQSILSSLYIFTPESRKTITF